MSTSREEHPDLRNKPDVADIKNVTQWWEAVEAMVREVGGLESHYPEQQNDPDYLKFKKAYQEMAKKGQTLEKPGENIKRIGGEITEIAKKAF